MRTTDTPGFKLFTNSPDCHARGGGEESWALTEPPLSTPLLPVNTLACNRWNRYSVNKKRLSHVADANLEGKHTNYSARRTMITPLKTENVNPVDISQLSGDKNLKSIDSYSAVSKEQQKRMSLIISNRSSGRAPVTLL